MFFGASMMIALVANSHDDSRLIVIPAMCRDAGTFTQFGASAIRRNEKTRVDVASVAERDLYSVGARIV